MLCTACAARYKENGIVLEVEKKERKPCLTCSWSSEMYRQESYCGRVGGEDAKCSKLLPNLEVCI